MCKREKILRFISGTDNLKAVALTRLIIGIIFIGYGLTIFSFPIELWTKSSLLLAFFGLGLMFIFDGQSILREYLRDQRFKIKPKNV